MADISGAAVSTCGMTWGDLGRKVAAALKDPQKHQIPNGEIELNLDKFEFARYMAFADDALGGAPENTCMLGLLRALEETLKDEGLNMHCSAGTPKTPSGEFAAMSFHFAPRT
jgi:hypothetical protein